MYHHKNAKLAYWYVLVNHGLMSGRMLNVIFGVLMAMLFCSCRNDKRSGYGLQPRAIKERFRPMPICSPILFPTPHALVTLSCSFIIFWFRILVQHATDSCASWLTSHFISIFFLCLLGKCWFDYAKCINIIGRDFLSGNWQKGVWFSLLNWKSRENLFKAYLLWSFFYSVVFEVMMVT